MINLHYVRAAIEANTGIRLTLPETRRYLVEEGLITQEQADRDARLFRGYGDLFRYRDAPYPSDHTSTEMGLPDCEIPGA